MWPFTINIGYSLVQLFKYLTSAFSMNKKGCFEKALDPAWATPDPFSWRWHG
jgi:hypothetical protein